MSSKPSPKSSPAAARKPGALAASSPKTSHKSLGVADAARTPRGSATASAEPSPRGSRKELLVEDALVPIGTVKSGSRPGSGSGRTSPRVDLKSAAVLPNPPGSLKNPDALKSWEVRGLLPLEWKRKDAHKGKFRQAYVRFLHELMSGYDEVVPGSLPVFEVTLSDIKESASMVAEEGHPFVVRTPTVDGDVVDLSFSTSEEATALLARADPDAFPHGLKGDLYKERKDNLVWRVSVLPEDRDGHTCYDITCVSPNDLGMRQIRLRGSGRYSELKDQHQKSVSVCPESASIPFPPSAMFGTKDPKFIQDRAYALRQYFHEALQNPSLMLFWRNCPLFRDSSED